MALAASNTVTYFKSLALLGVVLLWGTGVLNGTIRALLSSVFVTGQLTDADALKTDYTGLAILDYPVAVLVAFFYGGTKGDHRMYSLFLLDAYATLQAAYVWLYAETIRRSDGGHRRVRWIGK